MSKEDQHAFGVSELQTLTDFYGQKATKGDNVSELVLNKQACMEEWSLAKEVVMQNKYVRGSISMLYKFLFDYHKETFPNLLVLANLALIMPYQTAECERGFSCQNGIKSARRNRLQGDGLNVLMTKCEGGSRQEHDFAPAAALWKGKKERRLPQLESFFPHFGVNV